MWSIFFVPTWEQLVKNSELLFQGCMKIDQYTMTNDEHLLMYTLLEILLRLNDYLRAAWLGQDQH
jgi:hypothetical protein